MAENVVLDTDVGSAAVLAGGTRLGGVELTVTDLERSIAFYSGVLGLQLLSLIHI